MENIKVDGVNEMSQMEVHIGRLLKVDRCKEEPIENWCKEYCNQNGVTKLDGYYDSWEECFRDEFDKEFIVANNDVFRIIEDKEFEGDDIFEASKNELGQIQYCLSYYNGGCGFTEAIETALERMENN